MLYVRFLSSLSPPLDTFATLSKVYRPSQTPHPAMSSKDMGRRGRVPHNRIPRGFLHVLPPYRRPTLLTEFRVAPPFRRSFNRMKLIETPQPPSCTHWEARASPHLPADTLQMAGRPAFRPASYTSPPPPPEGDEVPRRGKDRRRAASQARAFWAQGE